MTGFIGHAYILFYLVAGTLEREQIHVNLNVTNPQDYGFLYKKEADRALWSEKKKVALKFTTKRFTSLYNAICGFIYDAKIILYEISVAKKQTTACSFEGTGRGILWFATFPLTAISICDHLQLRSLHNVINDLIMVQEFAFTAYFLIQGTPSSTESPIMMSRYEIYYDNKHRIHKNYYTIVKYKFNRFSVTYNFLKPIFKHCYIAFHDISADIVPISPRIRFFNSIVFCVRFK
jgi:hypothetical protein